MHTLIFDFGNVIGFFDHRIAIRRFIADCDLDEDSCFACIYDAALEDDFESGRIGGDDFVRRCCKAVNYRGTPEQFRRAFEDVFRANPPVCDLIPRLAQRHRLVLASNTNEIHAPFFRNKFADVLRHFAAFGLSHEAGARKPHRRFFEYCQKMANCSPSQCLFVDDLPANVTGAREFGWRAITYTSFPDLLEQFHQHGVIV
jgi:putative hydrolase of the HAD superfamily